MHFMMLLGNVSHGYKFFSRLGWLSVVWNNNLKMFRAENSIIHIIRLFIVFNIPIWLFDYLYYAF